MPKLPRLSIAAKLYTIFALLATATMALAFLAAVNSRQNTALTADFKQAFLGAQDVERVNGLVYAVVMESRGVYMSPDIPSAKRYGDLLLKFNERIAAIVAEWRTRVGGADAAQFAEFDKRIQQFMDFRKELARLGSGPVPETKVRIEGRLDPDASTGVARGGVEDTVTYYAAFRADGFAKRAVGAEFRLERGRRPLLRPHAAHWSSRCAVAAVKAMTVVSRPTFAPRGTVAGISGRSAWMSTILRMSPPDFFSAGAAAWDRNSGTLRFVPVRSSQAAGVISPIFVG